MTAATATPGIFFIVGSQRSGTTLLRLMLGSHPGIHCFDELHSYDLLREGAAAIPDTIDSAFVGFKIPRWTESLDLPRIPDMKQCAGAERFYTRQPVLFIVRDPLDVVASMMDLRIGAKSWLEVYGIDDLRQKFATDSAVRSRYAEEFEYLQANASLAGSGALLWKIKNAAYTRYAQQGFPVLKVDYEQLVDKSRDVMQQVLAHIGCGWDEAVLAHHTREHPETLRHGLTVGKTDPKRMVSRSSVGRWKAILDADAVAAVRHITGDFYAELGGRP